MAVQVAAQLLDGDELGQAGTALGGGLELASVLTQLGRYVGEAEALVDLGLVRAPMGLARRVVEQAVLGDVQAAPHGHVAQGDVVLLGASEVLQQIAELVGGDDLEIDREAGVGHRTGAGLAHGA